MISLCEIVISCGFGIWVVLEVVWGVECDGDLAERVRAAAGAVITSFPKSCQVAVGPKYGTCSTFGYCKIYILL